MQFKKNAPIGLLGGTFDPIHHGHLRMAIELLQIAELSKVHVIPCYEPVHKQKPTATPLQRLAMVELAIENEPRLVADNCEIARQGPSYIIDTLEIMHHKHPHTPLCLIIGIDAFLGFLSWHKYEEILQHAHLIVAHRPSFELPQQGELAELLSKHRIDDIKFLHKRPAGSILVTPITPLEISATVIRKEIAMRRNPRYLFPDSVYDYILRHSIYI